MAGQERDPRAYELMTIFLPELSDEDGQVQIDTVTGYISSANGTVKEVLTASPWGRRRLAYTIRFNGVDYRDGIYSVFHLDAVPSAIAAIERDLKLDTNTMRYLLVHDDPKAGERFPQGEGAAEGQESGETSEAASGPTGGGERSAAAATRAEAQVAPADTGETTEATTSEAPAEAEPEIANSTEGDPATTDAAAEEQPAETLTEDAVSADDEPATEPAPEQLDPESTQVPESRVVTSEPEADTAEDSAEATPDTSDTPEETGTASTDDESEKE